MIPTPFISLARRVALLFLLAAWAATSHAEFSAGIASQSINPDKMLPACGGVGPSTPTSQRRGDLVARALYFADADTKVAIVSVDLLGLPAELGDRARHLVPDIPPENILIGATHTHSAPDPYGFPNGRGGTDADIAYLDNVCEQIAAAIREAQRSAQLAILKTATGDARGKIAYNAYAEALFTPSCQVAQFIGRDGKPIATLVNYAIHPEVLGAGQGILSPDLIGPLYDRIAANGGGMGIFMNGAQGGMVTADCRNPDGTESRTWEECVRIGHLLADEALRIIGEAPSQNEPEVRCATRMISFPVESPELLAVIKASPLKLDVAADGTVDTQLNWVQLGDARMLTIPGEALPNIGAYLSRKMPGKHKFLLGLTNDAFGYILAKEDWNSFRRYAYVSRVCLGERTGEILVDAALKLIEEEK